MKEKRAKMTRRANRTRAKIEGTSLRPRLSVFRSVRHISAQLINDETGKTIVSASDMQLKLKGKPVEIARQIGEELGKRAIAAGVNAVVFDRGSYQYAGAVKALAEGARASGLQF
ncbi:MAG: 50S ribosomal protein L18 [Patescibacteria group bacterium]